MKSLQCIGQNRAYIETFVSNAAAFVLASFNEYEIVLWP